MKEEGNVAITGRQFRVVFSIKQFEEVSCTVEEPQPGRELLCAVAIEGKVDVGRDGVWVVYPQHTL